MARELRPAERWPLTALCVLHAVVFAVAGVVLPWHAATLFSIVVFILAALHAVTAVAVGTRRVWARSAWGATSVASLLACLLFTGMLASSALYLVRVYGSLGQGLAAALAGVWAVVALFTIPLASWGSVTSWPSEAKAKQRLRFGAIGAAGLLLLGLGWVWWATRPTLSSDAAPGVREKLLAALTKSGATARVARKARDLYTQEPVVCSEPVERTAQTLVVTFRGTDTKPRDEDSPETLRSRCIQGDSPDAVLQQLEKVLENEAATVPIKLDWVRSARALHAITPLLDGLSLRPGLDGACRRERCLMPWQLLSAGSFSNHRPLSFIPDLQLGFSPRALAGRLGDGPGSVSDLVQVATESWVFTERGQLVELSRMRPLNVSLDSATLEHKERAAERYIVHAQDKHGQFRYTLDPFTGEENKKKINLARQAGTALVLCELGSRTPEVERTIVRALETLVDHERVYGGLSVLTTKKHQKTARLASNALPFAALVVCRDRVGERFDISIARLARLMLTMQRPDGGFFSHFGRHSRQPIYRGEPLYAPGQAILGLSALERIAATTPGPFPDRAELSAAVERAMTYVATRHWNHALRDFFFLEENWHCLAARASLDHHRNDAYERFCIDYVTFKSRLILEKGVAPDFVGGFGFGNIVPPHNTGAAGFAEAMSAAIDVMQARGEDTTAAKSVLEKVLAFLVRQEWSERNCFACASKEVLGAMSEHIHSPVTRIDFAQHMWAGIGHARRVLGLVGS